MAERHKINFRAAGQPEPWRGWVTDRAIRPCCHGRLFNRTTHTSYLMAVTRIEDVIVPEVFMPYVVRRTAEKSRLVQSGIMANDPVFNQKANGEGRTVQMPFWNDLDGEDEVVKGDGSELTPGKLGTNRDAATKVIRAKAWSYDDLVPYLAGSDPSSVIGDRVADYRVRRQQAQLIAVLKGVFASASMAGNTHDIYLVGAGTPTSANILNGLTFIDAKQKLGDSKDMLTAIVLHSAVEALLSKLDLIDFIPPSEGKPMIKVFQGLEVIIDDGVPTETIDGRTVYTSYLFGQGAIALGNGDGNQAIDGGQGTWEHEFVRQGLKGESTVIFRWRNIMHPRGIKWLDAVVVDKTPSNVELANGNNWTRVWDNKLLRIVRIRSNVI